MSRDDDVRRAVEGRDDEDGDVVDDDVVGDDDERRAVEGRDDEDGDVVDEDVVDEDVVDEDDERRAVEEVRDRGDVENALGRVVGDQDADELEA